MKIIVGRGRSIATQRMDISDATVSREHCWLTDNGDGSFTLENNSPQGTFVNGQQVIRTRVTLDTNIRLGPQVTVMVRDLVPLPASSNPILNSASFVSSKTVSIKPLELVWNAYDRKKLEIQEEAAQKANQQRIQGIFSMLGMALGLLPIPVFFRIMCVLMALGLAIYFFLMGKNSASVQRQLHDLDQEFAKKYRCPSCGYPFGNVPYTKIRFMKQCPSCNCKYSDVD